MVSSREMARADAERVPPAWLHPLLKTMFFEPCPEHPGPSRVTRSSGCNLFCTDCTGQALCYACIPNGHAGHLVIQVRKSSKHNIVKVTDVEALLDVDGVQQYQINNEMVVFLNPRPQMGNGKPGPYRCNDCSRALIDGTYRFCSLKFKPESESESSKGDAETNDDAISLPTSSKRLGRGNQTEEDGTGTSAAPTASPGTTLASSNHSSSGYQ